MYSFLQAICFEKTVGRALYFYQQSPLLLPTSQGIQHQSIHMDQGDTKVVVGQVRRQLHCKLGNSSDFFS